MKVKKVFKITWHELSSNASFAVAFLGLGCDNIVSTCLITYGTLILTDTYEKEGKTDKEAENHLALLLVISTSIKSVVTLTTGFASDYFSPHKVMFFMNCITIAGLTMLLTVIHDDGVDLGIRYDITWITCYSLYATVHVLSLVLLSK